jgi:hypothetical protein
LPFSSRRKASWKVKRCKKSDQNLIEPSNNPFLVYAQDSTTTLLNNWKVWPFIQLLNFKVFWRIGQS